MRSSCLAWPARLLWGSGVPSPLGFLEVTSWGCSAAGGSLFTSVSAGRLPHPQLLEAWWQAWTRFPSGLGYCQLCVLVGGLVQAWAGPTSGFRGNRAETAGGAEGHPGVSLWPGSRTVPVPTSSVPGQRGRRRAQAELQGRPSGLPAEGLLPPGWQLWPSWALTC